MVEKNDNQKGDNLRLVQCTYAGHAEAILAILNEAILHSTALYDYKARSLDSMVSWFSVKERQGFPVIGIEESESGQLRGFASYGTFRAWPAYKYSIEHSVYVHADYRGQGLGRRLMQALIEAARANNYHCVIGGIDMENAASIALHEKLGFTQAGVIRQAGFKFGKWLDLGFYQMLLATPLHPVEE